jgi:deoxyribose-phosphate aldolase
VCAVVGFPLGANAPTVKAREAEQAVNDGACELDMTMQIGALRAGDLALVQADIRGVVEVARDAGALVKVIVETGLLARDEIVTASRLAEECGAAFVKTCTGFGPRGVTREDVTLVRRSLGPNVGVKAAGGIRTAAFALELLETGADRLGCSNSVQILAEIQG